MLSSLTTGRNVGSRITTAGSPSSTAPRTMNSSALKTRNIAGPDEPSIVERPEQLRLQVRGLATPTTMICLLTGPFWAKNGAFLGPATLLTGPFCCQKWPWRGERGLTSGDGSDVAALPRKPSRLEACSDSPQ